MFTAAEQTYADAILDVVDEGNQFIKHRLYRQHCIASYSNHIKSDIPFFVKDMRVILDRELKDIILVDNSLISFAFSMNNGVPIESYYRHMNED